MLFVGLIALAGAFVFAYAAYKDTSPADELLVAFGVKKGREGGAPLPSPVAGRGGSPATFGPPKATKSGPCGRNIGMPYQGTHTRGNWESDNAVDIQAPNGTPILAPFEGRIGLSFGYSVVGGYRLHVHGSGSDPRDSYFAHLSGFAFGIGPGRKVRRGQVIGYVGNTGNARGTSPHLHFAVPPPFSPASYQGRLLDCG